MMKVLTFAVLVASATTAWGQPSTNHATAEPSVDTAHSGNAATPAAPLSNDPAAKSAGELRQICAAAMNADESFARGILATIDKRIDQNTINAHLEAQRHVQKNERHVIIAYVALWVIAAAFLAFLWMRQRSFEKAFADLQKELEAAGSPTSTLRA